MRIVKSERTIPSTDENNYPTGISNKWHHGVKQSEIPSEVHTAWFIGKIPLMGIKMAQEWANIVKRNFEYFSKEDYDYANELLGLKQKQQQ